MNFRLKSPCKDCPFLKDSAYLSAARINEIFEYARSDDVLFPCHKTVDADLEDDIAEFRELIDEELHNLGIERNEANIMKYTLDRAEAIGLQDRIVNAKESACAGWLILAKKEKVLFNNFRIRLAAMSKEFDPDQLKNEDLVFNSISDARIAHERGIF